VVALTGACTAYAWGNNGFGELGLGDEDDREAPEKITFLTAKGNEFYAPIHAISAGANGSAFITESGKVYATGDNEGNKLGLNRPKGVAASMARQRTREAAVEEGMEVGQINATSTPLPSYGFNAKNRFIVCLSLGTNHSAAVDSFGKVLTVGDNSQGQLGVGDTKPRTANASCVAGALDTKVGTRIACGNDFTVLLTQDDRVFGWVRCAFSDMNLHSRMPLAPTPARCVHCFLPLPP